MTGTETGIETETGIGTETEIVAEAGATEIETENRPNREEEDEPGTPIPFRNNVDPLFSLNQIGTGTFQPFSRLNKYSNISLRFVNICIQTGLLFMIYCNTVQIVDIVRFSNSK